MAETVVTVPQKWRTETASTWTVDVIAYIV